MRDNFFKCDVGPLEADENEEQSDDNSDSTPEQIQVKQEQWYSTDEGMKLFGLIFNAAKQNGFEVVETSRDVDSHDIRLALRFRARRVDLRLEFPADFPKSEAIVVRNGDHKPLNVRANVAREDLAQELCLGLKRLLEAEWSEHNNKGRAKGKGTGGHDTAGTRGGKGAGGHGTGGSGGGMGAGEHGIGGSGGGRGAGGHGTGGSEGGRGAGGHGTGGSGGGRGAGEHETGGSGGGRGAGEHGTGGSGGGRGAGSQVVHGVPAEDNVEGSNGTSTYV